MQKMASTSLKVGEITKSYFWLVLRIVPISLFFILYHYLHNFHSLRYFL